MTRKLPEILTGLVVIIAAGLFLVYALGRADTIGGGGGYQLRAQFSSIGGLTTGSDVKIGGVVVGHVIQEHLDPTTYAAVVNMLIDGNIKIPSDTSASVSSDGLLGGNYIALSPGGSDTMLAPNQSFAVTQSAINIEDLLGKFIFSMGGGKPASTAPPGPSPAAGGSPAGPSNPASLSAPPASSGAAPQ